MNTVALAATRFAELARAFCTWCEGSAGGEAQEVAAAQWLARLHAEALTLPKVACENSEGLPDIPASDSSKAQQMLNAFSEYYYREFFNPDPKLSDEHVIGDVQDDLLDVYKDVKGGLIVFDRGEPVRALWHWSFLHQVHWGRHAVGALYALYCKSVAHNEASHAP